MTDTRMNSTAFSAISPYTDGVVALRNPRRTLGEAHG